MGVLRGGLVGVALCAAALFGQQAGPTLNIDVTAERHTISQDVYGINFFWDLGQDWDPNSSDYITPDQRVANLVAARDVRSTTRRWGGNGKTTYDWKFDLQDLAADWFFEVLVPSNPDRQHWLFDESSIDTSQLPSGSSFNRFVDQTRTSGGKVLGTIPILDWLPKQRQEMCSYSVAKYGKQCKQDPYAQYHPYTCGNGIQYDNACGDPSTLDGKRPANPVYIQNDPTDVYRRSDENYQTQWVQYVVSRYGKGSQGGVNVWSLDNEPIWWDNTQQDLHPQPYTYDELISRDIRYAEAVKRGDPTALVSGPVGDNWASLWMSKKDIVSGSGNWFNNPVDRNAHGGVALTPWYLQQMQKYEQQNGKRLLDYLDMHAYIGSASDSTDAGTSALRLADTRRFWDPTYVVSGDYWIRDVDKNGAPIAPQYIRRVKAMIDQNYPGTKLAITEYNFGRLDTLNGGLAQADLLGIFGREGLDLATLWGPSKPTDPGAFAFKMYRNYDGIGATFGETSVHAASDDQGQLAVYAAERVDHNLTAVVINKTGNDLKSTINVANFNAGSVAQVWRYSGANLAAIVPSDDVAIQNGSATAVFPANSITMLVIPPATLPVDKPQVQAVTNAASYAAAVAPGQMVIVWGKGIGPDKMALLGTDANGMVSTSIGGVRVLFDGVPSPMVYASSGQTSAVVPYFGAIKATTHVQVEYQGVRSDPVEVPVVATAPGIFTKNASGTGQGSVLNQDGITPNSANAPAAVGSVVVIWATGEGITDPPGVDGRLAIDVRPKPVAPVTVEIGGLPATVQYAGAAPYMMPGIIQINAKMDANVQPGNSVPVHVTIGATKSQDGVTIAVK